MNKLTYEECLEKYGTTVTFDQCIEMYRQLEVVTELLDNELGMAYSSVGQKSISGLYTMMEPINRAIGAEMKSRKMGHYADDDVIWDNLIEY